MKTCKSSHLIGGLDEVGMGCLAGPLVVCVAVFDEDKCRIAGVRDSKKCTASAREKLMPRIVEEAQFLGIGYGSASLIDKFGMTAAWQSAAKMALRHIPPAKELVVDGLRPVQGYAGPQTCRAKADVTHWQVSAASIVAKVIRDAHMEDLSGYYPDYGFSSNSGYGTEKHRNMLLSDGPTPIHRMRFLKKILGAEATSS